MKVIDLATKNPETEKPGALAGLQKRLLQSFSSTESRAQDTAIQRLGRVLDNRFTLLRNLAAAGAPTELPVMLITGPSGLWIVHASAARGLFRANEGQWEGMSGQRKNYRPIRPNLIEQIQAAGQGIWTQITNTGIAAPQPEIALLFVDPGAHVDVVRPEVRIVQSDALERFASGMLKADIILDADTLRRLVDALTKPQWGASPLETHDAAFADLDGRLLESSQPSQPSRFSQIGSEEPEILQRIGKRAAFTRRQWILLGVLLVVNFLILIGAILFALATLQ